MAARPAIQTPPRTPPPPQSARVGPATSFDATWMRLQSAVRARDTAAVRAFFANAQTSADQSAGSPVSTVLGDRVRTALLSTGAAEVREEGSGVRVFVVDRAPGSARGGSPTLFGLRFAPGASGSWRIIGVFVTP